MLSAVKLRSLWVKQPSPKVALTLLTIKSTSCVLPFRLKFLLRVKRAYRRFLLLLTKVTQRNFWHSASKVHCALPRAYLDAMHRDCEFSLSAERRHFGLCKSKSVKHRIVFLRAHCGTRRIAGTLQHASMWTISSLANEHWNSRCYRLRDRLSLVGGYVIMGVVFILPMILPKRSFCPRGSHLAPSWHEAQEENKKRPILTQMDK